MVVTLYPACVFTSGIWRTISDLQDPELKQLASCHVHCPTTDGVAELGKQYHNEIHVCISAVEQMGRGMMGGGCIPCAIGASCSAFAASYGDCDIKVCS